MLSGENRRILARLARMHTLLVFDFDGTLAPIVPHPEAAAMNTATRGLLRAVCRYYPCAVLSGRSLSDLKRKLGEIDAAILVGNHGGEWDWPLTRTHKLRAMTRRWRVLLSRRLASVGGVRVEDKGLSLAIHYRHAVDRAAAKRSIRSALAAIDGAHVTPGKCVMNVLASSSFNKGAAMRRLHEMFRCEASIVVGDDFTDESAFACADLPGMIGIRVGAKRNSSAAYYLRSQGEVELLLRELLRLRNARLQEGRGRG